MGRRGTGHAEASERGWQVSDENQVQEALKNMMKATIKGRGVRLCRNVLTNLGTAVGQRCLGRMEGTLSGVPIFIVSAGPSLDKNVDLLHEAKDYGVVMAVNTACPALEAKGITPHIQINVEPLELSSWHGSSIDTMLVGLSCNPKTWELGRENDAIWTLTASPHLTNMAMRMRARPLLYAGAVATAAYASGLVFGCNPVILVGQDLAYDLEGGKAYADGSAWGGMTLKTAEDGRLEFGGKHEERVELHRAHQVPMPPKLRDTYWVERYGGEGEVPTTVELQSQRLFFEKWSGFRDGSVRMINATEGGGRIKGWEEMRLADVLAEMDQKPDLSPLYERNEAARFSEADLKRVKDHLIDECSRAEALAHGMKNGDIANDTFLGMCKGMPFVEGMAAADIIGLSESEDMPKLVRLRATYEIVAAAAQEVRKYVNEWPV